VQRLNGRRCWKQWAIIYVYPVVSNVQYRLSEVDGGTLIKFHHAALGLIEINIGKTYRKAGDICTPACGNAPRRRCAQEKRPGGKQEGLLCVQHAGNFGDDCCGCILDGRFAALV